MSLRCPCSDLQGAFWGLIWGLLLGLIRLLLDFIYPQPRCDQRDERPAVVKDVHYLYFSMVLSAVTLLVMSAVSWATQPPSKEMVGGGSCWIRRSLHCKWQKRDPTGLSQEDGMLAKLEVQGWASGTAWFQDPEEPGRTCSHAAELRRHWGRQRLGLCPLILTEQKCEHVCPS